MRNSVLITFLGNPIFDTRIKNLMKSFSKLNYKVSVLGFEWNNRQFDFYENVNLYNIERTPSVKFYLKFLFFLFTYLIKHKADYYFAEDIYTLGLVSIFGRLRKKKIFYNSRELYPYLAGLRNRKLIQFGLASIEKTFIRFPDYILTTGDMDSEFLRNHYKIKNVIVLRNLPALVNDFVKVDLRKLLSIPQNSFILFYQGVVIDGRGIKIGIQLLQKYSNMHFVVLGDGEKKNYLQEYANTIGVGSRVHFLGSIKQEELVSYTASADLGLALIENISLSYYYALPSKLFEYIMAEIPVLCSNLPQMKRIIKQYNVGRYVDLDMIESLDKILSEIISNKELMLVFKENCKLAKKELNWENEFRKLEEKIL